MTASRIPNNDGGIQPTLLTAKGDLLTASATSTVTNLPVGADGQTLVANSASASGLQWQSVLSPYAAGKNKIINGDFGIWQRGTSFTNPNGVYTTDRFYCGYDGSGSTRTISQQAFTAGTAPVAGYESQYFMRIATTVAGSGQTYANLYQPIEDVRTFAGQTITLSFWAKADASRTLTPTYGQIFGSGGSGSVYGLFSALSLTTSWQRFTTTVTLQNISGKTIGAGSMLQINLTFPLNTVCTIDYWGVQLEAGSVATAFQTATGTIQSELAACQRYYFRNTTGSSAPISQIGIAQTGTTCDMIYTFPVTMRVIPSAIEYSGIQQWTPALSGGQSGGTYAINVAGTQTTQIRYTHGSSVWTAGQGTYTYANTANGYIGFTAEL